MSKGPAPSDRPPFDPSRVPPWEGGEGLFSSSSGGDGPTMLTVSQLTKLVRGALRKAISGDVHVVGELSNLSEPAGGHLYFTLKDETSEVRCVMWRSSARFRQCR